METFNPIKGSFKSKDPLEQEGYDDYQEGADYDDCSYPEGSDGEQAWHSGWSIADRE